jgi:hypothetical protein
VLPEAIVTGAVPCDREEVVSHAAGARRA